MNLSEKTLTQYLAVATFALLWLNVGVDLDFVFTNSWVSLLNGIRLFAPGVCFLVLLSIFLIRKSSVKVDPWLSLFCGYFVVILISSLINSSGINNLYFPIMSIIAIGTVLLLSKSLDYDHLRTFRILAGISALILFLVLVIFTSKTLITGSLTGHIIGYNIGSFEKRNFLELPSPLPTGIARSYCITSFFALFLYWNGKLSEYNFRIVVGIIAGGLLFFQSRGAITALFLTLIFIAAMNWVKFEESKKTAIQIVLCALGSFALLCAIPLSYFMISNISEIINETVILDGKFNLIRNTNPESLSSGRTEHWFNALHIGMENIWLGFGSQADRILLGQSVSSAPLYAFLCGGLFALSLLSVPFLRLISITSFLVKKSTLPETKLAFCIIIFLILRGGIETGLAVYGIDLLLAIPSLYFLFSEYRTL